MKIDYIELPADDLKKVEEFYSKSFGWQFQSWSAEYISFDNAGVAGGFYKTSEPPAGENHHSALVVLYADDLKKAKEIIIQNGGLIIDEATFPGGKRFRFKDPAGNCLGVWTKAQAIKT